MKMFMSKRWLGVGILLVGAQIAACGSVLDALPGAGPSGGNSDTSNLGSPPPIGTLSGVAKDALIQNANVNVYAWNGSKGELLGSAVTDQRGRYSLQLQVRSQSVLLEVTGGRYTEEATGRTVDVADNALFALQNYTRGQTLTTAITYYTTLATGLAENLVRLGMKPSDAVQEANERLSAILGIDTVTVMPTDVVNPENLSFPELRYGIATAALSSLTERASILNGSDPHAIFNSIRFIQEAYDDVRADGVLDGRGTNGEVAFGRVRLTAEVYRHELALHILRIANNKTANRTGLGPTEVFDLALRLNGSTDPIFGDAPVIPIDRNRPNVTALTAREFPSLTNDSVVFGAINFTAMVMSFPGASSAELVLDNDRVIGTAVDPENPLIFLDTFSFPIDEGQHTLTLRVTDISGATGESPSLSVTVSNRQTAVENVSIAEAIVGMPVLVTANIADPAGVASVVFSVQSGDGTFVPVAMPDVPSGETMFPVSAQFDPRPATFADGAAAFRVEVTNSAGFTFSRSVPFTIDRIPPRVVIANPIQLDTNPNDPQGRYFDRLQNSPCTPIEPARVDDPCLPYVRRDFNLSAAVSDTFGLASITLAVDGQEVGSPVMPTEPSVNQPFTIDPRNFVPPGGGSREGQKTVMVIAEDKAQNRSSDVPDRSTDSRQVVFDTTPPEALSLTLNPEPNMVDGRMVVRGVVDIAAQVQDRFGVAAASLSLEDLRTRNVDTLDQVSNQGTDAVSLSQEDLDTRARSDGSYRLALTATDRAGNQRLPTAATIDLIFDNTPPTIEIDQTPTDLQIRRIATCNVTGLVADLSPPVTVEQSAIVLRRANNSFSQLETAFVVENGTETDPVPVVVAQDGRFSARVFLFTEDNRERRHQTDLTLTARDALGNASTRVVRFTSFVDRDATNNSGGDIFDINCNDVQ